VGDVEAALAAGQIAVGVAFSGPPPAATDQGSTGVALFFDESDIRSEIAANGLLGILTRDNHKRLERRLEQYHIDASFVQPLAISERNVATPERMAGSRLGQVVPLILIIMTITGAVYPAIDLTAGERERGTLETLMVAPTPTVDLITGKFVVVTLIGLMSALLNLVSVGGTIYFGGIGSLFGGGEFTFPLGALPWILLLLIPLAVMFSAMLLAVCSFARSFKEAQNYVLPVMMAALIPGVVGILPGTRLEGPIVIVPVTNIVVLTRELFMGALPLDAILWVMLSTSLYAAAAVAVAAKLFGQEAVLFADAGSVQTIFQRRHFRPRETPSAAQALLILTIAYSLNFFVQDAIQKSGLAQGPAFLVAITVTLTFLLVLGPMLAARYTRVALPSAFSLKPPAPLALAAGLCFGLSTWILVARWMQIQQQWLPMDERMVRAIEAQFAWLNDTHPLALLACMALAPAFCEELFFRGFLLSGLRRSLGAGGAVLAAAVAFGLFHYSAHRLVATTALGVLLGLLVIRGGSVWPAALAHALHNGLSILAQHPRGLASWLERLGYAPQAPQWALGAGVVLALGLALCLARGAAAPSAPSAGPSSMRQRNPSLKRKRGPVPE